MHRLVKCGLLGIAATEIACGGGGGGDSTGPVSTPVASVAISPSNATVAIGTTAQLVAITKDASGATLSGKSVAWSSNNPAIALVNQAGLVTAIASGTTMIEARSESQVGIAAILVEDVGTSVAAVTVAPTNVILPLGTTLSFVATATNAAGNVISGQSFSWASSNSGIASVTQTGQVTSVSAGSVAITATVQGKTGTAPVRVAQQTPVGTLGSLTPESKTACAVSTSGVGFCWGDGAVGQLGNGDTKIAVSPIQVGGALNFASIAPAIFHTCGLTTSGAAYCWGRGDQGALGNGSLTQQLTPTAVSGGKTFAVIRTGFHFSCGLDSGGDAYCWGDGQSGILGNGTLARSEVPVAVSGGLKFRSLVTGFWHACGITTAGTAYCWGRNVSGELGDGTTSNRSTPTAVSGGVMFTSLAAGERSTCALDSGGAAYCWGVDWGASAGGSIVTSSTPTLVAGGLVFTSIDMGNIHTCALRSDGSAYCWGNNSRGALGDGTTVSNSAPVAVSGGLAFSSVQAANGFTCGLITGSGNAYCWGRNELGELGNASIADSSIPVRVSGQP